MDSDSDEDADVSLWSCGRRARNLPRSNRSASSEVMHRGFVNYIAHIGPERADSGDALAFLTVVSLLGRACSFTADGASLCGVLLVRVSSGRLIHVCRSMEGWCS